MALTTMTRVTSTTRRSRSAKASRATLSQMLRDQARIRTGMGKAISREFIRETRGAAARFRAEHRATLIRDAGRLDAKRLTPDDIAGVARVARPWQVAAIEAAAGTVAPLVGAQAISAAATASIIGTTAARLTNVGQRTARRVGRIF